MHPFLNCLNTGTSIHHTNPKMTDTTLIFDIKVACHLLVRISFIVLYDLYRDMVKGKLTGAILGFSHDSDDGLAVHQMMHKSRTKQQYIRFGLQLVISFILVVVRILLSVLFCLFHLAIHLASALLLLSDNDDDEHGVECIIRSSDLFTKVVGMCLSQFILPLGLSAGVVVDHAMFGRQDQDPECWAWEMGTIYWEEFLRWVFFTMLDDDDGNVTDQERETMTPRERARLRLIRRRRGRLARMRRRRRLCEVEQREWMARRGVSVRETGR